MRQLTSLDAQFLAAEDGRTHGHVSAVSILDPSTAPGGKLTLEDVTSVRSERLHLLPPLRWRLVGVPLRLDYPYWLDDPDFDLEFHIRELRVRSRCLDACLRSGARPRAGASAWCRRRRR